MDVGKAEGGRRKAEEMLAGVEPWRARAAGVLAFLGLAALLCGSLLTPPWGNAGLACLFAAFVLRPWPIHRSPGFWLGTAVGGWVLLSVIVALVQGTPGAQVRVPLIAYAWLVTPLVAAAVADANARRRTLGILAGVAVLAAVVGMAQWTIGLGTGPLKIDPTGSRWQTARGFSALHLTYGYAGALLLVVALQSQAALGAPRGALWTLRVALVTIITICGSRAGQLGAVAGVFATCAVRSWRWLVAGAAIALLLAGALAARLAYTDSSRLTRLLAADDGRWPIWQTTVHLIREAPLLGTGGRDAYKAAYNPAYAATVPAVPNEFGERGGAPHAHHAFLSLAVEYGVVAPLLHLAWIGAIVLACWRRRREAPTGFSLAAGVATVVVVAGQFEPYTSQAVPGLATATLLGVAWGLSRQADTTTP